jgi:hypothetical protein
VSVVDVAYMPVYMNCTTHTIHFRPTTADEPFGPSRASERMTPFTPEKTVTEVIDRVDLSDAADKLTLVSLEDVDEVEMMSSDRLAELDVETDEIDEIVASDLDETATASPSTTPTIRTAATLPTSWKSWTT